MSSRRRPSARILTPAGWAGIAAIIGLAGGAGMALLTVFTPR
ncbi:hypothetical protein [Caulobacter sp. Root1472]|nr:hypothetical protein [Caulobacter sp. Root1472]